MRGRLARDLMIFGVGLVLGYLFAVYGGADLVQSIAGRVPDVNLSRPAVVLIVIGLVVLALIFTSRGRK